MIYKNCKRFFMEGNRSDGMPNGVGFVLKNGRKIDLCADCLISLGRMDDEQKEAFMKKMKDEKVQ